MEEPRTIGRARKASGKDNEAPAAKLADKARHGNNRVILIRAVAGGEGLRDGPHVPAPVNRVPNEGPPLVEVQGPDDNLFTKEKRRPWFYGKIIAKA